MNRQGSFGGPVAIALLNLIEINQKHMEMSVMGKTRTNIEEAAERIAPYLRQTPVERSSWLSDCSGGEVFLKLENFQITGSFKARGALNKLTSLTQTQRRLGVVTASSGNHGAAVAFGSQALGSMRKSSSQNQPRRPK